MSTGLVSLWGLDPDTYTPHAFHAGERAYTETNCYADIWIELVHACGFEPASMMAFCIAVDFEGDQWTFFKPPPEDIERLFGIDVHEMQIYRPLIEHIVEQLHSGRTVTVEMDSWYLPDTAATSYRREHVKTSIAVEAIDPDRELLRYFHGAGYWQLQGDDYRGVFRLGGSPSDEVLPPYIEIVRFDAGTPLTGPALRREALAQLARHLQRRPRTNPLRRFGDRLAADMPLLLAGESTVFHAYAFATVRQFGASFEILASFAAWLAADAGPHDDPLRAAAQHCGVIVDGSKRLLFKLARQRAFDPSDQIDEMAEAWDQAMASFAAATAAF